MGGVCGVAVESDAVRISYFRDGQRVEDSIDAEGAHWLLNGKLVDCGPFDDVVLTGREIDVVESLLDSLDTDDISTIRVVDEGSALLAYARSVAELAAARALLVLDLGRYGTSTFTLDVVAGEVTRSDRRTVLSGEGLDDTVERLVMGKKILPPAYGVDAQREYRAFFRELKELVSTSAGVRSPGGGPMLITRDEFENAIGTTILHTLAWAAPTAPDAVMLIGGGARIPLIRALVEQQWSVPVVVPESPSSVILQGAALEATPSVPQIDLDELLHGPLIVETDEPPEAAPDPIGPPETLVADPSPPTAPISVVPRTTSRRPVTRPPVTQPPVAQPPVTRPPAVAPVAPALDTGWTVPETVRSRSASVHTRPTFAPPGVAPAEPVAAPQASRRRSFRWSVRDAAVLVGIAAVVALVWAVIVVRGDPEPPPGIGVDPVSLPIGGAFESEIELDGTNARRNAAGQPVALSLGTLESTADDEVRPRR